MTIVPLKKKKKNKVRDKLWKKKVQKMIKEKSKDSSGTKKNVKKKNVKTKKLKHDPIKKENVEVEKVNTVEDKKDNEQLHIEDMSKDGTLVSSKVEKFKKSISKVVDLKPKEERDRIQGMRKKDREIGGFTFLGSVDKLKKAKVARVLPYWLSHPVFIRGNLRKPTNFLKDIHYLDKRLIDILIANEMECLFPVQCTVIPDILSGTAEDYRFRPRDICVASPTGSGKTLAYVLPIVQYLSTKYIRKIRAVVILPVVELARQVYDVFCKYTQPFDLRIGRLFGFSSFENEQGTLVEYCQGKYYSKVDVIVATPGRLSDHMSKTLGLDFTHLRFLVFDEADQLFSGDFSDIMSRIQRHVSNPERNVLNMAVSPCFYSLSSKCGSKNIEKINSHEMITQYSDTSNFYSCNFNKNYSSKKERLENCSDLSPCVPDLPLQRLLFSATLSTRPQELQNISLYRPVLYLADQGANNQVSDLFEARGDKVVGHLYRPAELIEQYITTTVELKPLMLHYVIHKERKKTDRLRALVFASSTALTLRISLLLHAMCRSKYNVEAFTSRMGSAREELVERFRSGDCNVLVSTDAMARGMDLPDVDLIISYDVPSATTYIHRIGRTARAGHEGKAISIITGDEIQNFKKIFGKNFKNLEEISVPEIKLEKFDQKFRDALEQLSKETRHHPQNMPKTFKKKINRGKLRRK